MPTKFHFNYLYLYSLRLIWILVFKAFKNEFQLDVPDYKADATVLKTIMRSNPGTWLLSNGVVKGKWHSNTTPDADEVKNLIN